MNSFGNRPSATSAPRPKFPNGWRSQLALDRYEASSYDELVIVCEFRVLASAILPTISTQA
jgi:hypothetical protein